MREEFKIISESSLLDFQDRLAQVIEDSSIENEEALIGMCSGKVNWLLDLSYLNETSVPSKISRIGGVPEYVLGISGHRGQVLTVLDMKKILEGELLDNHKEGWVISLREKWGGHIAFLWPQIVGLVNKKELLDTDVEKLKWSKKVWKDQDGKTWQELDIEALLNSSLIIEMKE